MPVPIVGNNLIIPTAAFGDPSVPGGNSLDSPNVEGMITFTEGEAATAAAYQIGRDADATNQLHLQVPTGASLEYSVNDVPVIVASLTLLDLKDGLVIEANEPIQWDTGGAFTSTLYQIGRNADATNLMQLQVPTGASFEFSVNDVAVMTLTSTILTLGTSPTITNASGNLTINSAGGSILFAQDVITDVLAYRGTAGANLTISANLLATDTTARRLELNTIDTVGDARILVAYAIPTSDGTTPFWAQRGNITVPIAGALDANFLTFRWNSADDSVTVYVNDGGTIRSVSIGTVV